jgi:hypothetical protein
MNDRKIEVLGPPRRSDAEFPRLLALSRGHHFGKVADVTESLFAYCDGIALLQHTAVPGHEGVLGHEAVAVQQD